MGKVARMVRDTTRYTCLTLAVYTHTHTYTPSHIYRNTYLEYTYIQHAYGTQRLWLAVPCAVPGSPLLYTHTNTLSHTQVHSAVCRTCLTIAVYTHIHIHTLTHT